MPLAGRRIGLLTASASRLGGGVFEAVVAQAALIRGLGGEAVIYALADRHAAADRDRFGPSEVRLARVAGPAQIGYAPELGDMLRRGKLDCLHLHGIWMYPSRAGAAWARRSGRPYLVAPHGMLDPWITARGKWKKALARLGYERAAWGTARAFHALTASEAADIQRETGRSDSIVIPNAGPPAAAPPTANREPLVLYLGRIHPKKNIDTLIAAWTRLASTGELPSAARLVIAGWGDDADVQALRSLLEQAPNSIAFVGAAYGEAKSALLRSARFLALPSFSEGLPMVVLEGWANGLPVVMTRECHLPEGFDAGAAIDCGTSADSIAAALRTALAMPEVDWLEMARASVTLADTSFAPATIAAQWGRSYAALMNANR